MRILVIAPYYAPFSEVSAVRIISLSRQLYSNGHDITVMCYSNEMLESLTDKKNLRSSVPPGVKVISYSLKRSRLPAFSDLIYGHRFSHVFKKKINLSNYDVVFLTCGPFYTLSIVPYLHRKKMKTIIDFRDLGAIAVRPKRENVGAASNCFSLLFKRIFQRLVFKREKKAVECASSVIAVSDIDKKMLEDSYGITGKVSVATNGFDDVVLNKALFLEKKGGSSLTIGVFGKFMYYSIEKAIWLLRSVYRLRSEQSIDIKVVHIGIEYPWISQQMLDNGIPEECYKPLGLMEYLDGMKILATCDCFAVEDTSPDDVGTKIYDYIYLNKPVFVIADQTLPLSRMVKRFQNGFVCDTEETLFNSLCAFVKNKTTVLDEKIDKRVYSRSYQNDLIIDKILEVAKND